MSELPEHAAGREPGFGDRQVVGLRVQEAVECLLDAALADHPPTIASESNRSAVATRLSFSTDVCETTSGLLPGNG